MALTFLSDLEIMEQTSIQKLLLEIKSKKSAASDIDNVIESIKTKEDLAQFIIFLRESNPALWENSDLKSYLEAIERVILDLDGFYKNRGENIPSEPRWKDVARILWMAGVYD